LRQSDEQFAYDVVARALHRTTDANRFLDSLSFAWTAAQAAIYAIVFDKANEYHTVTALLLSGFILAILGTGLTFLVSEGVDPEEFAADFPDDPKGTRFKLIDRFVVQANRNDRLRIMKAAILVTSVVLTTFPLIIATAARMG